MTNNQPLPEILTRGVSEVLPDARTLAALMQQRPIRVYLGIDPTAAFLTLGHGVVLRKLQQFADAGHDVILLVGNGTVKIGDPTGRDTTRPELTDADIAQNFKDWQRQASKILDFSRIRILHNGDWLNKLDYSKMVKLLAKTTVQQLLERDMFQDRLKNGLPIFGHEIIYPLLQGFDSVEMEVDLEIGGTDQTFNMMMGRQLLKTMKGKEKWVLTTPVINGTDGRKMSKSFGNFVALTDDPINMFGKIMSVADNEIITYFTILTDTPTSEIEDMDKEMANGGNPMKFKKKLAWEITKWLHNADEANKASEHFAKTVQKKEIPDDVPEVTVTKPELTTLELLQVLMPAKSNSELRRLITQGAVEIIGEKNHTIYFDTKFSFTDRKVVRVGKRGIYGVTYAKKD